MRKFLLFSAILFISIATKAQSSEDSVKTVVNNLFAAMKAADPEALVATFADSAILQTIAQNKVGEKYIRNESVKQFATSIGGLKSGAADERIVFETVKIDADLALVWTPYKFYFNGNFSHCGVNSFHLVRIKGQWKIQYLIDTRRKTPCE
ncbi:nuclear transport factor 2 family protein [Pollutibacter soli]|uniref:nuclear transport factor 2 family protein n=1 Tax=Pollutibacter soli TaxID=3034157 RepID=UPI0030139211